MTHLPEKPDEPHFPYTSEWFEQLLKLNPMQAACTLALINGSNGDREICGACGDKPSKVYRAEYGERMLVRLCDDCKRIQGEMYQAKYSDWKES